MKTTLNQIESLGPCEAGWKKLLSHLGPDFPMDKEFPISEVVKSNGIDDTFWVLRQIIDSGPLKKLCVEFSCDCAERFLPIYEAQYPENKTPRQAIEAARHWLKNPIACVDALVVYVVPDVYADTDPEEEWRKNRLVELLEDLR